MSDWRKICTYWMCGVNLASDAGRVVLWEGVITTAVGFAAIWLLPTVRTQVSDMFFVPS